MPDANITKKALATAMKDLMATEPFAKISVGDVCQACGMNRKSFYYHFQDKYDLVNWIFYTEFVESLLKSEEEVDGWAFFSRMFHYFYAQRTFYINALQIRGQNSFWDYFIHVMGPFLRMLSDDMFGGEMDEFMINFYCDAFLSALTRWLREGAIIPPDELIGKLETIIISHAKWIESDNSASRVIAEEQC